MLSLTQKTSWTLTRKCSDEEWQQASVWLKSCVEALDELNQKTLSATNTTSYIPNWLWRFHQKSLYRLNSPPVDKSDGKLIISNKEFLISPAPMFKAKKEVILKQTVYVVNEPHEGGVEIGPSLHYYAWIGTLLLLTENKESPFKMDFSYFTKKDLDSILNWAKKVTQ